MTSLGSLVRDGRAILTPNRPSPLLACSGLLALLLGCGGTSSTMAPPTITTPPASLEVLDGAAATFSVTASGEGLRYQWSRDGAPVSGATSASYTLPVVAYRANHGATFTVAVLNDGGQATSTPAKLTVRPLPTALTGLTAQTVQDGGTATLRVSATGTGPFTYQWRRGGKDVPGATSETLTLAPVVYATDHRTPFSVLVTNAAGTSTPSPETQLTVTPLPTVLSGLEDLTAPEGATATFRVQAAGTGPFTYQWRRNDLDIPGATGPVFQTGALSFGTDHRSRYTVVVTNGAGQPTSSAPAILNIQTQALSLSRLMDQTVTSGEPVTFQVVASGTGPFTYQWFQNGSPIPGALTASYTLSSASFHGHQGARFSVKVTDAAGQSLSSNAATLTVLTRDTGIEGPSDPTVTDGDTVMLSVTVRGTPPFKYQWLRNGAPIPGATLPTYTRPGLVYIQDHGSTYAVTVTNAAGITTQSRTATLQVMPKPTLLSGPDASTGTEGKTTTFSVTPSGTPPWSYQWLRNGAPIPGARSSTYTTPTLVYPGDAGAKFSVQVTNGAKQMVTSPEATLSVLTDLQITTEPEDQTVTAPDSPTFRVVASGSRPLTYRWLDGTTPISGQESATFTFGDYTDLKTVPGFYSVQVSDGVRSLTSRQATFTVVAPSPTYPEAGDPVSAVHVFSPIRESYIKDPVKFPSGAFRFGYSEALKNPVWTATADFKVHSATNNSGESYLVDDRLEAPQVSGADMGDHGTSPGFYLNAPGGLGFDRGHMVMQSDVTYRYGDLVGTHSNRMSNLIPQVSSFNQGIWQALEQKVGGNKTSGVFDNGLSASFGRIWIYTGPVFPALKDWWVPVNKGGAYTRNREALPAGTLAIAIPTACYKVVLAEPKPGEKLPRVMAWLASNRPYSGENGDLWKYTTSIQRIEELTGLTLFPGLAGLPGYDTWRRTVDVRGFGSAFEQTGRPNVHMVKPSWDIKPFAGNPVLKGETATTGVPIAFEGAATPHDGAGTVSIASTTWKVDKILPPTGTSTIHTATGTSATYTFAAPGDYQVTFTAMDSAGQSSSITRVITVADPAVNQPPVIQGLANKSVRKGTTPPITLSFTVGDDSTLPGDLVVTATSKNPALLQNSRIRVTNTFGNVTLELTPEVGVVASGELDVSVSDGSLSATKTITFTVAENTAPVFTPDVLPDKSTSPGKAVQQAFTLSDDDTAVAPTLTASSGNPALLQDSSITVAQNGGACTLTLAPTAGATGDAEVTVIARDSDNATTTRTFMLRVAHVGPTFKPDPLPNVTTPPSTTKRVSFEVEDDLTTAELIAVSVSVPDSALLKPSGISMNRTHGLVTLDLTPEAGQKGSVVVEVTARDEHDKTTVRSFTFTVDDTPQLIISQYYEGTPANNKWIEITNVGTTNYNAGATPLYLGLWSNPVPASPDYTKIKTTTNPIPSLAAGATILYRYYAASGSTQPTPMVFTGTYIDDTSICSFNGNDPVFITKSKASTVPAAAPAAWMDRIDAIGTIQWGADNPAADKSYVRKPGCAPTKDHSPAQWDILTPLSLVDTAPANESRHLGFHIK